MSTYEHVVAVRPEFNTAIGMSARTDHVGQRRGANPMLSIVRKAVDLRAGRRDPRYRADDDPTYPDMLDNRGWSRSVHVGVNRESKIAHLSQLGLKLDDTCSAWIIVDCYRHIELSPEQLEVKQRLIADRYAKQVAKAEAAFAKNWTTPQRAGVTIVRCRHCGLRLRSVPVRRRNDRGSHECLPPRDSPMTAYATHITEHIHVMALGRCARCW